MLFVTLMLLLASLAQHDPTPDVRVEFIETVPGVFDQCITLLELFPTKGSVYVECVPEPPIAARIRQTIPLSAEDAARYRRLILDANLLEGPFNRIPVNKADELFQSLDVHFGRPRGIEVATFRVTNNPTFSQGPRRLLVTALEQMRQRAFDEGSKRLQNAR